MIRKKNRYVIKEISNWKDEWNKIKYIHTKDSFWLCLEPPFFDKLIQFVLF